MAAKTKKVVLGVCGSIAAYKAGDIIRRLQDHSCDVSVVMTPEAEQFITAMTLATLSGREVVRNMFDADAWRMAHIDMARHMDVLLIAPATANMIGKMAAGIADDVLSALVLSVRVPVLVAPAMNDDMYTHPLVQDNVARIKKCGVKIIEPVKGRLACGVSGVGHLADVDDIVKAVLKA